MKALLVERFGPPHEALALREVPSPKPSQGEVLVRMIQSPINPSDLLMIQGTYGKKPYLPFSPGFEGVGTVLEGKGILSWRVLGKRVAVINGASGNWAQEVVIPSIRAVPVPSDIPDEQVASFFINPATVLAMVTHRFQIPRGSWLVQSGASTAVGLMVARLGKKLGFKTLNLVRRKELLAQVEQAGGDRTLVTEGDWIGEARAILGPNGAPFGLDCIGGEIGAGVLSLLGAGGRLQVYGNLSGQPLPINPDVLRWGMKKVEGFWLSDWANAQNKLTMLGLFRSISNNLRDGTLTTKVGGKFPLERWKEAIEMANQPAKPGKVLLQLNG